MEPLMTTPTHAPRQFQVAKTDLARTRFVEQAVPPHAALQKGQVLLAIDRVALTANNITYAAFGERMKYWDFFPAPEGWGIIPVWGYADVVASCADGVAAGARYYGYYPMATHAILTVARTTAHGFSEGTPQRQPLAAVYNQYQAAPPGAAASTENLEALLKPLFSTSWLIADWLADNAYFGAASIILSSASSKTAYGTAHSLKMLSGPRPRIVGLTSAHNVGFTQSLGCYDDVCAYDAVASLSTAAKAVYVDMAGDAPLRAAIHGHFGDQLAYSCSVGGTHWEHLGGGGALAGPRPVLFFAPAQIKKRAAEWGAAALQTRLADALAEFQPRLAGSLEVIESRGVDAIEQAYQAVLSGRAGPRAGHILRFQETIPDR
jgi:hypothetical protein